MVQFDMLPPKVKDIAGKRFGRLVVIEFHGLRHSGANRRAAWECRCDCGRDVVVNGVDLCSSNTQSCGCLKAESSKLHCTTHGHTHDGNFSGAYRSWRTMRQRCNDPNCNRWSLYGGRGIRVCERWNDFKNFHADMGDRPPGGSLERIDPNGDYEPGNCKWLPRTEQSKNTRSSRYVVLCGERMIQAEAARRLGVTPQKLDGWRRRPNTIPADLDLKITT